MGTENKDYCNLASRIECWINWWMNTVSIIEMNLLIHVSFLYASCETVTPKSLPLACSSQMILSANQLKDGDLSVEYRVPTGSFRVFSIEETRTCIFFGKTDDTELSRNNNGLSESRVIGQWSSHTAKETLLRNHNNWVSLSLTPRRYAPRTRRARRSFVHSIRTCLQLVSTVPRSLKCFRFFRFASIRQGRCHYFTYS